LKVGEEAPQNERKSAARQRRAGWLNALDGRLPEGAVVWDLGGAKAAAALLSTRHRYHGVVPDRAAMARVQSRAPDATFVEGTSATVEIERGTADAVIAPTPPEDSAYADVCELVERAAGWLKPGGLLLVNVRPGDLAAYALDSWLDAGDEAEPRRALPTAGVLHAAGLEIRDYELSPAGRGTRALWLIAARPAVRSGQRQGTTAPTRFVDLQRRTQPLTVFIHIPKTAGTTFTDVLLNNHPPDTVGRLENLFAGARDIAPEALERMRNADAWTMWMHALRGHHPLGIRDFLPADTRYVTFLREPVDRLLSHYHFEREHESRLGAKLPDLDPDTPFGDALADGRFLDNVQTRILCGDPEPFGEVTREMLDRAKENLRSDSLVFGLTERFDESLVLIGRRLGFRDLAYQSRHVNSRRPRHVSRKTASLAREFDRYDIELYEDARELFAERVAGEDEGFVLEVNALRDDLAALDGSPG
jgi:hypothetical protein